MTGVDIALLGMNRLNLTESTIFVSWVYCLFQKDLTFQNFLLFYIFLSFGKNVDTAAKIFLVKCKTFLELFPVVKSAES